MLKTENFWGKKNSECVWLSLIKNLRFLSLIVIQRLRAVLTIFFINECDKRHPINSIKDHNDKEYKQHWCVPRNMYNIIEESNLISSTQFVNCIATNRSQRNEWKKKLKKKLQPWYDYTRSPITYKNYKHHR